MIFVLTFAHYLKPLSWISIFGTVVFEMGTGACMAVDICAVSEAIAGDVDLCTVAFEIGADFGMNVDPCAVSEASS